MIKSNNILYLYCAVFVAHLLAELFFTIEVRRFTKPLLMPVLLFYIYQSKKGETTKRVLLLALAILFSWIGDIILLNKEQSYFLAGVTAFFAAQLTYALVLYRSAYGKIKLDALKTLPFVLLFVALMKFLVPDLPATMVVPVLLYGAMITIMVCIARLRSEYTNSVSYQMAFWGAILFLISDSILAINAFSTELPYSGFSIMLTYCSAQLLLVQGVLKHIE